MKKLAVIAALLLSSSLSMAADYNPRVIKFAATSPKGTPPAIGMELFAKIVQERSDGKIKVDGVQMDKNLTIGNSPQ